MSHKSGHIDSDGNAQMVDVSGKRPTKRTAQASVVIRLKRNAFEQAKANEGSKGAILTVAKIAGIQAAKKTAELIPLCHQLPLECIDIDFDFSGADHSVRISSTVRTLSRTGVEMEALTACSVAALAVYDMLKSVQKDIIITDLKLLRKTGGLSGEYDVAE